jgi:hypothetical protein
MLAKLRVHVGQNVVGYIALFVALGGTGAYAADTIGSSDVINESLLSEDVKNGEVKQQDLANGAVTGGKLAANSVLTPKLADNSVTSAKVLDFGLSNEDVGVLFAQVNADGTLANSSGGVTSGRISVGNYVIDFGRNISACAFVMTQGEASAGSAGGAITGATDRAVNVEAVFATTRTADGVLADRAFQLVVVC